MSFAVHSTRDYHVNGLETLGWELTVCNALHPADTPLRKILKHDASYGELLADYLGRFIPMKDVKEVIEIGGGYGVLMKDLLTRANVKKVTMLDISPFLLQKQREALRNFPVSFRQEDFLETDASLLQGIDLAILNENLGDFPTITGIGPEIFSESEEALKEPLPKIRELFQHYALKCPEHFPFNLNIGALEAVQKLCASGVPFVFLSEHSCEASVPDPYRPYIHVSAPGIPERIRLRGHDEYTIKFSYLETIAKALGYKSIRGPFADIIPFDFTEKIRIIMKSRSSEKDEYEIIRHFVEDLYQYEYLLLVKDTAAQKGKVVECLRCGRCCLTDFIAYVTDEDMERWRHEGRKDILGVIEREHAFWAGDHFVSSTTGKYICGCPFLAWETDHSTCTIYETRPLVCRHYPPASSEICTQYGRNKARS